ncbi:hypothetical protein KI387_023918, partial [Taxus chinensis]
MRNLCESAWIFTHFRFSGRQHLLLRWGRFSRGFKTDGQHVVGRNERGGRAGRVRHERGGRQAPRAGPQRRGGEGRRGAIKIKTQFGWLHRPLGRRGPRRGGRGPSKGGGVGWGGGGGVFVGGVVGGVGGEGREAQGERPAVWEGGQGAGARKEGKKETQERRRTTERKRGGNEGPRKGMRGW